MRRTVRMMIGICVLGMLIGPGMAYGQDDRGEILKVRESVWRAWFANDAKALERLVPPDTIVISSDQETWKNQADILRTAAEFQADGGKLVRLEFPHTEIQRFGDVAIIWTSYLVETEENGKREVVSGRATEIFVHRNGEWVNPGWHTDNFKAK
ncbi:MAG: nuclear transport factor 2 family protein [Candidatus Acidiferrales bacterium]|jgi:ketosteroid isomerase-like protein